MSVVLDQQAEDASAAVEDDATNIAARPAVALSFGFRLLVLRQFIRPSAPPAFAYTNQSLLRRPDRPVRHGISFELTFLPDIVAWLIEQVGKPSMRVGSERPKRNPDWPVIGWHAEDCIWPDDIHTIDWSAEVSFPQQTVWSAFQARWKDELSGKPAQDVACGKPANRNGEGAEANE